jgi:hypothetical protein
MAAPTVVHRFGEGFCKSALMILVSEVGDKTFFIAAVMAMRNPQLPVRRLPGWPQSCAARAGG